GFVALEDLGSGNKIENGEKNADIPLQPRTLIPAPIPIPGEPLPSFSQGYQNSTPDIFVRVEVTYLRQDFSMMQPVKDAILWPEMQRFDFLVRERILTENEAKAFQEKLATREPGSSPYQRAALAALRELTGRDAEPTGPAWRKALNLPQRRSTQQ